MNEQNTTPPDMIAQAGELLRLFQLGMPLSDGTHGPDSEAVWIAAPRHRPCKASRQPRVQRRTPFERPGNLYA